MRTARHSEIADELRHQITSGTYEPGVQLPTEPELEAHFQASRNTVRLAVSTLVNEGLIQLNPGRGMFVPVGSIPFTVMLSADEAGTYRSGVKTAGREPDMRNFATRIEYPSAEIAGYLEIDEDSQVVVRSSERFIDGRPYSLQRSYYPMDIAKDTELTNRQPTARGTIALLRELGYEQVGTRDIIRMRMPTPDEKSFFKVGPGIPVATLARTAYTAEEQPIRLTVTIYAGDRNLLSYEMGQVPPRKPGGDEITTTS